MSSRRRFLSAMSALALVPVLPGSLRAAGRGLRGGPHPTPRSGVSAARIATNTQLKERLKAVPAFEQAREIPAILDGIRCQCGCTDGKAYYSLLSCFETPDMMAAECEVCQSQARLAFRLNKAGKSLDEIRRGIDAKFS